MKIGSYDDADYESVIAVLIADLAYSAVPTTIMGFTLVGVATFAYVSTGMAAFALAATCGGMASIAKLVLIWLHKRHIAHTESDRSTIHWERFHAATTASVAAFVGITATYTFISSDYSLKMLGTGLIFGYCSGIVSRVSIRPKIAITALLLAALPPIIAAFAWNDASHYIIGIVFLAFLVGSFDSVRHVHRNAVYHVSARIQMTMLAQKDSLTGLANQDGLNAAFQNIKSDDAISVLYLDLNGFKSVNDNYGHAAGDVLLKLVADRLLVATPAGATAVRMGGDEFAILLPGMDSETIISTLAMQISSALKEPFSIEGKKVRVSASVGYASTACKPSNIDNLLSRADAASYIVKNRRREDVQLNRAAH